MWLRKWWIVACVALLGGISYVRAALQPEAYLSQAEVLVLPVNVPEAGITSSGLIFMANEVQIAGSAAVAERAAKQLDNRGLQPALVEVSNPPETQAIDFIARSADPRSAQASAQAYADAYLDFRRGSLLSSIDAQLDSIRDLTAKLEADRLKAQRELADADTASQRQALQIEILSLSSQIQEQQQGRNDLELASKTPVGQLLQPAALPSFPSSARPSRALILGALVGLLFGVGLAFLRDRLDQRLRGRDDIESIVHAPVLGRIPDVPSLHRLFAVAPGSDQVAGEAFRSLRTRVLFATRSGSSTVMITSPTLGEGKTTVAANVAMALAQADVDVVLVSADLRRPGIQRYFPQCIGAGVADVLNGRAEAGDVVVGTSQPHLVLVPSGTSNLAPEAGLGTNVMLNALTTLAREAKVVIVDAPPVLGISDTLDLASLVDHVILVVDARRARRDAILESRQELRSVGASVLGVVLTHVEPKGFGSYHASTEYTYATLQQSAGGDTDRIAETGPVEGERDDPGRPVPALGDARAGSGSGDS